MTNEIIKYMLFAVMGLFGVVVIAYIILMKRMNKEDAKKERELKAGVETTKFSMEVVYQIIYNIHQNTRSKKVFSETKKKNGNYKH